MRRPCAAKVACTLSAAPLAWVGASDIEKFCPGVPPRQGMIKQCMSAHMTELSAGCFNAVMGAISAAQAP